MDEEAPKKTKDYVLGTDIDRYSLDELRDLETVLEAELERVERAIAARQDVRAAAEAFFRSSGPDGPPDGSDG